MIKIHPTAIVDANVEIGEGTSIWHWVHVSSGASIGRNCSLGQGVYVGGETRIGNNVRVQNNVSVYDRVYLEDDVFCGPSAVFTNVINPRAHVPRKNEYRVTQVRRGASLGANCTIVCGVEIGAYAMIGAGAVVTKDVAPHALMVGTPARRRGWMCQCGVKLPAGIGLRVCPECGDRYEVDETACRPVGKGEQ